MVLCVCIVVCALAAQPAADGLLGTVGCMRCLGLVLGVFCWCKRQCGRLCNPQPTTFNLQPTTNNPQPTTNNQQPKTYNPKPTTHNQQSTTNNQTTYNPQPTTVPGFHRGVTSYENDALSRKNTGDCAFQFFYEPLSHLPSSLRATNNPLITDGLERNGSIR